MLGIFDSGFGGLPVLRAIREALPEIDITYLGDNARAPYGNRSRDIVTKYTKECCTHLFERGCNLIVLACNTASADTLRELQTEWLPQLNQDGAKRNIIGVVRPLAEEAASLTAANRIAVVGTRSTVSSNAYVEELKKLNPEIAVEQQACPLLVPLVEEGWESKPETKKILRTYLMPLKSKNCDVLILGCTHYETLHSLFARKMGASCTVLHTPSVVAGKLAEYLSRHPEYEVGKSNRMELLTTGDADHFQEVGSRFLGWKISQIKRIGR